MRSTKEFSKVLSQIQKQFEKDLGLKPQGADVQRMIALKVRDKPFTVEDLLLAKRKKGRKKKGDGILSFLN